MEPLPVIAACVGLVVGALLAAAIRGRQLARQRGEHEAQSRAYEEELGNRGVKIETLEVDRATVQDELDRSRLAADEAEANWLREQDAARERLAESKAGIDRLSAELDQLREQLGRAHRDIDLQKQAGRDLEDQLAVSGQQLQVVGEQLEQRQQQLAATRRERDNLVEQLEAEDESTAGREPRRRWRINTFFES